MCDFCKNPNTKSIEYTIESANSKIVICPNCIEINLKTLTIPSGYYVSEISNKNGAVKISDPLKFTIPFFVTPDEAKRLLGHALLPNEYEMLLKNHKKEEFELHDDFYDWNTYLAWNPIDDEQYIKDLKDYKKVIAKNYPAYSKIKAKHLHTIDVHIKFLEGEE